MDGVDIAYLNAGVTTLPPGTGLTDAAANHISRLSDRDYRRIMAINVDGVVFGARAVVPSMVERGGGVIVATSSLAGLIGFPPDPIYAVTKHAVIGLVRSLGPQLAPVGISVHAVCPGITDTAIVADTAKDAPAGRRLPDHPARAHRRGRPHGHPLVRDRVRLGLPGRS